MESKNTTSAINKENIKIPIEHQEIVLDRKAKAKSNSEKLLDWNEVLKNFNFTFPKEARHKFPIQLINKPLPK